MIPANNTSNPLCITTAAMDGSMNDRATKRQRGVRLDEHVCRSSSNHTVTTSNSSVYSGNSFESTSNHKSRKSVSFAPITAIHGSDWTRDEVDNGWYSKDELSDFKQDRKALVKVLKRVRFDLSQVDTTVHCLRGYEAYFSIQANKEYKLKRQMVWKAVLQEQQRQRYQGRSDAMMMQLVSSHATQWARDTATELGMRDAQVALSIFLDYMQEQQEDDDDMSSEHNYDGEDAFDDAPIAVNWNEQEDFGTSSSNSMPQDSLELSWPATAATASTMEPSFDHCHANNVSFSSHQSFDDHTNYFSNGNGNPEWNTQMPMPQQQLTTLDNSNAGYHHHS